MGSILGFRFLDRCFFDKFQISSIKIFEQTDRQELLTFVVTFNLLFKLFAATFLHLARIVKRFENRFANMLILLVWYSRVFCWNGAGEIELFLDPGA